MSNSRLEKFIYAICGMDIDDLPTPLSRIETLWNCLITGETPDFEPLSRNEKYLMSMLNGDVDGLPEPTSRSEKLLYKIATGETDLSDVPGYLSRYEELLKQLIENGGIGGTDFEYVLYTLNQPLSTLYTTAEGPVKSAILKGQTLVNVVSSYSFGGNSILYESCFYDRPFNAGETFTIFVVNPNVSRIKIGRHHMSSGVWAGEIEYDVSINKKVVFTVPENLLSKYVGVLVDNPRDSTGFENGLVILEGDQTQLDIDTYFEGMQSVKMPVLTTVGKNLFDKEAFYNDWKGKQETYVYKEVVDGEEVLKINNFNKLWGDGKGFKISVKKDNPLTMSMKCKRAGASDTMAVLSIRYGDNARATFGQCKSDEWIEVNTKFTPSQDYIEICSGYNVNDYFYIKDVQLEEGSTATPYEPYKTNILTVNEEVELRGIGEGSNRVEDELDCLTGEVTQRIGEVVLDGSGFYINNQDETSITFAKDGNPTIAYMNRCINNRFSNLVYVNGTIKINVNISEFADINEFKESMTQNNLIIQFHKKDESIKTVVLSTLDQDGQPTKLSTFNDITHVSIDAEDLLPTIDLEVATKIEETLSSLPTLMNDISETQQLLSESIDDQSEDINEVSTAMAEIRSDILQGG